VQKAQGLKPAGSAHRALVPIILFEGGFSFVIAMCACTSLCGDNPQHIRVIKKKVNNRDGQLTVRPLRVFGQRHYTLKAGHLLEYWSSKGGLLHDDFFQKFKTAKLIAYITIYAEYTAGSPGFTLRERLRHELALRRISNIVIIKRENYSLSAAFYLTLVEYGIGLSYKKYRRMAL
jgi:hypothetical protein